MRVRDTDLIGLKLIEVDCFEDQRGFFMETWNRNRYHEQGIEVDFVQDNVSYSRESVLRGLHYQKPCGQGKLVYVLHGEVFDVSVDIRQGSPTYGKWKGFYLSGDNKKQLYIPDGFAHGFCVLSKEALFVYKCTDYYRPESEMGIIWNDPDLGIEWPISNPVISEKDLQNPPLSSIDPAKIPLFNY